MTNVKNRTNIILLGSIPTALIIPIGMNQAFAESENISDKIDNLIEKYNNLETKRHVVLDKLKNPDLTDDKKSQLEVKYDRIVEKMDRIETKTEKLALQETEYNPTPSEVTGQAITTGSTIYTGGTHQTCSNGDLSTTTTIEGDINTDSDTISWWWSITDDEKNVGWFSPFCTTVTFEEIDFLTRNISKGQSCDVKESNVITGTLTQTCNCGIVSGNLLSWQIETTYELSSGTNMSGNDTWYGLHRIS